MPVLNEKDEIDAFWRDEAEKRVEAIRNGKAKLIPGDQVFEKIRNRYKK